MFIAINRLPIKPDSCATIEERFAQPGGLEDTPGFIEFQLLKQVWNPHAKEGDDQAVEYLAVTRWASREDFEAWTKSDAFKKAHSGPKLDIFAGPGQPAGYDVQVERMPSEKV